MSESGSVEAQSFPIPTDDGERHANDMQHAFKPENVIPTAPPTPPKDRSLSADSGIALQKPQSPVTPPADDDEENELLREVIAQCGCAPNDVEDLYACTPLQEAMVAQTMREPSAYTIEHEFYLSPEIDPKKLQNAWNQTAQANPALRTRMVATHQRGCLQVVLRGPVPWQMEFDDEAVPEETTVTVWKIGAPLVYFSCNTSQHILRIKIHHSICDGWSIGLLLKETEAAYRGDDLAPRSFRPLIDYIDATKAQTKAFWEAEFQGVDSSSMSIFPQVPIKGYTPTPSHRIEKSWNIDGGFLSPGTVNSKLRLAWAILHSIYTGCNNVLFGAVSTGRGVPVEGVQEMAGPTIASVPVLIKLDPNSTVGDAVSTIQTNWGASMPFEHIGLQNLLHISPGAKAACEFQTLISVEPQADDQGPRLFSNGKSTQTAYGLFALIIRCRPTSRGIWIELAFDPVAMDARQGERVLSQLAHIYNQVDKYPSCLLSEVDCISPEDSTELSHMALTGLSSETPQCVHELFQRRVAEQPQAQAISSWDGDLSFEALDNISTALAEHLRRHISRGEFVPLCIGKSKWVAIAMLAVMKAGGAFVLLDTMHPIPRLQQMCQTAKASLLISSRQQLDTTMQLGVPNTIVVDDLQLAAGLVSAISLPSVATPDDPIYATFTSGSTGVPKCVIVHHAGYASSSLAHGGPYRFTPEARVLQFASPAFDSCIIEHLSTLIMGGCVCIPSADDCHSKLGESIQKFGVTVACLTPTVTRIINPEDLPTLDVMVFVGEAVLARDVERWQPHIQAVGNAYGPAECSAVFSVQPELKCHDSSNIGFPTGGIGWVVHPNDHNRLMPVGCTGELLIEGLIVGKGYLSNPNQTAKAFIESPEWRRQLQPAPTGHLYKTGDLVEYAGDGSFRYHGRKDTQAKVHGQRLELGEIEHHLRSAFAVEHVVAELIRSSPEDGTDHRPDVFLTAFVHHQNNESMNNTNEEGVILPPSDSFRAACANAEVELSDSLPQFMVPDVFLPISYVPLTPSGKTNRRALRDQVGDLSWTAMQRYRATDTEPELPSTAQEDSLRTIWAETLNRPIGDIGIDDSFFRLGGDSVSAMQMAASCQASGFNIVVADIFRCPSIRKLSEKVQKACGLIPLATGLGDTQTETRFDLSPIQQFFFDRVPDGHDKFTMEFLVRIARPLMEAQVEEAILALSGRHAMLRARFEKDSNGCWGQVIGESLQKGVYFRSHWLRSIHDHKDLKNILVGGRELLRPAEGTQMVANLLNAKEGQFLSLIAHHIVIDLVSWRVLLQDLEDILTAGRPLQPTSTSFQQWCKLQRAHIRDEMHPPEPLASNPPPMGYWGSSAICTGNTWDRAIRSTVTVGRDATQDILGKANDPFHTRPVELVQAAVLYSFVQVFDDRQAPTIFTEGHGRESWDARIDISRTVGWFTTIAPLFLDVNKDHDLFRLLELTKDGRRKLLSHGFSSFSRRYLQGEDRRSKQDDLPMEILFNYTGLFQQLERPDALLQFAQLPSDSLLSMPGDLPRFALIDVNAVVMDGYLTLNFIHNSRMKNQTRIMQWIDKCRETLQALPMMLQQEQRLTVSDLPLLSFAEDSQLRDLLHNVSSRFDVPRGKIEDIYPCTPLQLGIYISQLKNPQAYWSHLRWSVPRAAQGQDGPVDLKRVKVAWQKVVEHNPILRTVFIENTAYPREPVQVVLQSTDASIRVEEQLAITNDGDLPGLPECFHLYHWLPTDRGRPPHLLQITPRTDGSVFCQLTIHHILVDGATEQIFLAEFDRAYRGVLDETPAEKLGSYVNYLAGCDLARSKEYWKGYLKNLAPCIFPSLDVSVQRPPKMMPQILPFNFEIGQELHAFCRQNGMTVSSFLQVAWGLVLRTYTGSESVCFGYLHSCRDLPIVHADRIAGPMVNILVCQLSLDKGTLALETLLANHEAYANSIEHQHCSLAEMVHSLQLSGKSLFNTVMSIQKDVLAPDSEDAFEGAVEPEEGVDATEYDLTVNIATSQSRIRGDLTYWAHLHSHSQVGMIADAFHSSIMQLLRSSHAPVDSLAIAGSGNMDQILRFNKSLPESIETCIHTEIMKSSLDYPETVAVSAWDGDLTYGELKERANAVAKELALRSVGPGTFVPILSERSKWEPVSIVAVLEAGCAFILLDPAQPQDRLQSMIHDDFDCPVIIASRRQAKLAASIVSDVIVAESVETGEVDYEVLVFNLASVSAQSACYAVFSSGSTGKPKASVIEHRSYLSAAHHHSKAMDLNAQSRALHFASNAFDAAILEILSTLLVGGCVCIPSDDERNNKLEASIAKYEVTWTLLTPSVSRVLDPRAVPTLKTLVFGGERMSLDDIRRWSPYVACMNAYGPSEASVVSTCQPSSQRLLDDPSNIGHPTGAVTWALNSQSPHKPVPLGAIGELAVEGPIVGRGYVNRPDNMKESFLPYPEWLRRIRNTANGVLYKTGDLVRMMPDGSITYLGRRDNQVKLHGQRIELAEVEHQVQRCYPAANPEVFADLVTHEASQTSYLVATIAVSLRTGEELFRKAAHETKARLRSEVPSFLVPSYLFAAEEVPRLVNGKVDRRKLQQAASQKVQTEISQSLVSHSSRNIYQLTPEQRVLQRLWADILNRPSDSIFPEDDFFAIGGDSVAAMKLSSSTATEGLDISVSDIFLHSTLKDLANVAATRQPPVLGPTNKLPHDNQREAFSLLPSGHKEEILFQAMSQCCVPREQIQDVYPCTELQIGLAALTAQHQGASVARHLFHLKPGIDLNRLRKAWQTVMARNDILRTRLMISDTGYLQVLLKEDELLWITANECGSERLQWEFVFGQPLAQFEIIPSTRDQECETDQFDLLITMHHAVYDAWSLSVLVEKATLAYHDHYTLNIDAVPFRDFISYSISQEEPSRAYWSKQLRELKADQFPQLPCPSYRPQPSTQIERTFHTGPLMDAWVNRTAAIRLSWALVQSQYQNSDDIVFGVISNGRTAPVQGIEAMVGPTIVTYPLRVQVNRNLKGSQAIANLHQQSMELASFEQIGLSKIAALGADGARACAFQVLLMELRANGDSQGQAIGGLMQAFGTSSADDGSYTYAIQLAAMIKPEEVSVAACFDSDVVSEWQMSRMLDQFGHILQQVHVDLDRSVQDITTINRNDIQQLQSWYPEILDPGARTVVDCIHQQCITQPSAPAISSSTGDLSYEELKMRSDAVADRLVANGAGPGTFIPIYLEHSQCVPVAVLGVLKTGAAFVLLDTELPLERLRTICAGISASIIISSIATQEKASKLGAEVVTLMPEEALPSSRRRYESTYGPNQPLYVSFTSGSTGAPKGVVVSNNAFMATAMGHSRVSGLSPQSRVLQFASYAFDVSILELLPTLMAGGCLCIPSDSERRDQLAETVTALRTNFAMLTPSVLRTIDPTIAVSLKTVITGGESLRPGDIQQWAPYVNLLTGYGPAEAAVTFTMSSCIRDPSQATNIGSPVAGAVHVVDPRDPQRLVPIGAIGELLLQGPQVSEGYLNNPEKTRSTFIAPPRWLKEVHQQDTYDCEAPLYCTGDLVRYGQDGSLWFMGRKDNQAKLRGQRMELGEIEEQIKRTMIGVKDVVAEVITQSSTSDSPWLAAFVTLVEPGPESSSTGIIPSLDALLPSSFVETTAAVLRQLESVLPSYMVPSLVIPLRRMLHTPSGKVDRRSLREAIATIPRHELDRHLAPEAIDKRAPSTEAEYLLRDIWARVLRVTADEIGADDSFFRLGGDSISAVRATVEARSSGVKHSVGELLQWQTISVVAERSAHIPTREHSWTTPVPFSLVSDSEKTSVLSSVLCKMRSLMPDDVQDIIPAAPLQAFYITHSSPVSMTQSFETHFDTSRFRNACTRLVAQHTILRTAFVRHNKRFFQVILKEFDPTIEFIECADPEQWVQAKSNEPSSATTAEGSVPLAFTVVTSSTQQQCMLIIQISHAQYDGLSVPVLWEDLITAYQDGELKESGQFRDVVSYRLDAGNPSLPFWKDQLKGAPVSAIDPLQLTGISQPSINDVSVELKISQPPLLSGITLSTLVKAALAWVLSQQAESSDVILGQIVHGRGGSLPNIDRTLGPCLNQLPLRVMLDAEWTVEDLLRDVQGRQVEIVANDNVSFERIVRSCTSWPEGSTFGCFVHHQGLAMTETTAVVDIGGIKSSPGPSWATSRMAAGQVGVVSIEHESCLGVRITAAENTLDQPSAIHLAKRVVDAIELFAGSPSSSLSSLA